MVKGPGMDEDNHFFVHTVRNNPASTGVVTGKQTYASFLSSVLGEWCQFSVSVVLIYVHFLTAVAKGQGGGLHLC